MYQYEKTREDMEYLSRYNISKFDRPSLATDIVVLSVMEEGEQENSRKRPELALKVLMVKRATPPFKNKWALPGGFCRPGEDVCETARRELKEETGISDCFLKLAGTFGDMGRDPRGWIVSNTYLSLVNGADYRLHSGNDAWEARWFAIDLKKDEVECREDEITTRYRLYLFNEEQHILLKAVVLEKTMRVRYHTSPSYEIEECEGIGWDHAKIILSCLLNLRKEAQIDPTLPFDLLPEYFTLSELQSVFELVLDKSLVKPNFRRKIADYVEETERKESGDGAYRPAALYRRNLNAFYS